MGDSAAGLRRARRAALAAAALLTVAAGPAQTTPRSVPTPKSVPKSPPVTDANVFERVTSIHSRGDHLALADYYFAKAKAEEPRIEFYDKLFRAYLRIEGKDAEVLQRQARALLKGARMTKQHDELLGEAHRNRAWEWED